MLVPLNILFRIQLEIRQSHVEEHTWNLYELGIGPETDNILNLHLLN